MVRPIDQGSLRVVEPADPSAIGSRFGDPRGEYLNINEEP
jgi:hypothetical protein